VTTELQHETATHARRGCFRGFVVFRDFEHLPPMAALPASAAKAQMNRKPIEIVMACEAGRISIGEWAVLGSNQ
jgi:hypothetical protein